MPLTDFEITPLWANTLLVQPLTDHAPHSARLGELADQGLDDALFDAADPAVDWLKANIIYAIGSLLGASGFTGEPQIAVRARLETQVLGGYTSLDNRPGSYLTGLYVIRAPGGKPALGSRDDGRPGSISFYDPRIGMNMNAINKDPYVLYHHTVPFEPGLLLLWPAYVPCYVHPHLNETPALRVRMDVQVAASGDA
jgi:hypothetical protein